MEEDFKDILINQLKGAYRKYKNHIYYDNYSSIQRFNLSEFEFKNFGKNFSEQFNDNDFHVNFDNFFFDFAEKLCDDFDGIIDKIINEINVISIPKHFIEENNDNNIISNFNIINKKLNKVHYFIDLPVEGHILGVLWIIRCGFLLDDKLYSHSYGNRLNETFLEKIKNNQHDDFSPFLIDEKYQEAVLFYRLKNHYSPFELKCYNKYDLNPINFNQKYYNLLIWNNVYIAPYFCFEIADINDRSLFKNWCDIVTVSEFNKDTVYFNNIAESLARDLFCYCIKSNTSEFGGSVILQPSSSENKYLVNLKGGEDDYIVTYNLDIKKLRADAIKNDRYYNDSYFKPKPPGFDSEIIKKRMGLNDD